VRGTAFFAPFALAATFVLVGCHSSSSETPAPVCAADGAKVFALGASCVRLEGARVRSGGSWSVLPSSAIAIEKVNDAPAGVSAIGFVLSAKSPAEAFELTFSGVKGSAILQEGYQSWSFSGAAQVAHDVPLDPDGSIAGRAASTGDVQLEAISVSYGAALVGDPGGQALAIGSTSSIVASTAIAATRPTDDTKVTILYGVSREPLPAAADGTITTPSFVLAASAHPNDALGYLATRTARALPSDARKPRRPPGGWFSWNELFDAVDEAAITEHIDLVATKLLPLGMPLLEIDDGWEVAWGDWRANTKFPSGMAAIGKKIRDRGLVPGVWLAPFLVDVTSDVATKSSPTLFVRGTDGKPIVHKPAGLTKGFYVLDGMNPESMAIASKPIADLAAAGFSYFKLDFLYAGALPGVRSTNVTGVQALRNGLTLLRTAMGESSIFDACGAPVFPVLGLADALRVGSDTAFTALSLNWSAVAFAARSTSARAFLAPMVFSDGDQVQARAPFTIDEARAGAAVAALSGPAYALGDDLRKLPAERMSIVLDPIVIDLAGAASVAIADDPLETPTEKIILSPILDTIANPGSTGAPPPTRFTMTGKSGTKYQLKFAWTDTHSVTIVK